MVPHQLPATLVSGLVRQIFFVPLAQRPSEVGSLLWAVAADPRFCVMCMKLVYISGDPLHLHNIIEALRSVSHHPRVPTNARAYLRASVTMLPSS
jgi:hypothetical protein